MMFDGKAYDYVETAVGFSDDQTNLGPGDVMMESDHRCNPQFRYSPVIHQSSWRAEKSAEFAGEMRIDKCGSCGRIALLRMPQHFIIAAKLLSLQKKAS